MTSKDEILKAIRLGVAPSVPLPDLQKDWLRYANCFAQFQSMVESVGGRCVRVNTADQVGLFLGSVPEFANASRIVSAVPGVASTVDLAHIEDPHDLETVDWAIMPGQFGVAENGAVWVTDENVKQRAIYFIVQHLAVVIQADQIVHNLHEAYERLSAGSSSLGIFISGPSKTADIEQSLVVGASWAKVFDCVLR